MSQLPIGSTFGAYHIVRHIGGGGMAQIYLVKTRGLAGFEKYLALKVINPEYADEERFVQMLCDEAKLSVGLNHVNIGQVFDLQQIDGIYYIAMEFIDGLDVLELVNGLHAMGEKVPVEAVAYIGRQMCSGLHYAHTRKDKNGQPLGIVHRDISPQNILCSRAGEVKVVDFGIAKAAGMSTRTQAGVIKGKVHYMAPEQALGQKIDFRVDIFSSGIVLWEMLTSQMLYSGDNVRELVERVRRAIIPPPSSVRPEIPPALDAIVMKALSRRPEDRFATCHEFQVELTKFLSATAPEYSGTHLAALVERVLAGRRPSDRSEPVQPQLSREEFTGSIHGEHSLIRDGKDEELTSPKDLPRLLVEIDGIETVQPLEGELVIGRAGNLSLPDARVSRRHARIFPAGRGFMVEDLGSSNGTFVNEQRISGRHPLQHNDVLRVGSCRMRYLAAGSPSAEERPVAVRPAKARPRLLATCGDQCVERRLDDEPVELGYELRLGPLRLEGSAGRLVRREDGYWVEPRPGRQSLSLGGREAAEPQRLEPGASLRLGPFTLELRE